MPRDALSRTLSMLKPADLYPAWKWVELMERACEMDSTEAQRWKRGIFGLMELWGPEPDELPRLAGGTQDS